LSGDVVELVAFDLGGVVVRICRSWEEACVAAGVSLRAPLSGELARAIAGGSERLQRGDIDEAMMAREVSVASAQLYTPAEIEAVQRAWIKEPYAGVAEIVRELERRGVASVVLSNTSPEHWARLSDLPALSGMARRFLSFELGLLKPGASIYAAVETQTGFRGSAVAFFDDTPANVLAARARGWLAECVDPHAPTAPQMSRALAEWGLAVAPGA